MLEAINILFGDKVDFTDPWNSAVAFFTVVFTILVAEIVVSKIYFALDAPENRESIAFMSKHQRQKSEPD